MELEDVLTREEAKKYRKSGERIKRLSEELKKEGPKLDKTVFATSGPNKSLDFFTSNLGADLKKFWDLMNEANKLYADVKKGMDQSGSTHEFITSAALDLLGVTDAKTHQVLQKACMAPDREKDLRSLVFEGHFYEKVAGRRNGNFLERVFGDLSKGLLGFIDRHINDIDETALSNFAKYYTYATAGDIQLKELGWAAHYIQDLTAPHHAGNMAIGFETITDNCETHFPFEKFAKGYVYDNPTVFKTKAQEIYNEFRQTLTGKRPKAIAKEVQRRAVPNVPKVQRLDGPAWTEAIHEAIPLAIAATAFIFDPLKP